MGFLATSLFHAPVADAENKATDEKPQTEVQESTKPQAEVKLTTEQQNELVKLYQDKLAQEKKILDKYVEFKIMTQDTADKILTHKQEWYKNLEKSGFALPHKGFMHHKMHEKPE